MRADLRTGLGFIHDVPEHHPADLRLKACLMPRRHEALVMVAFDPQALHPCQESCKTALVVCRHSLPGAPVMKDITQKQQAVRPILRDHSGKSVQCLRCVIGRQKLSRSMIA